MPSVPYDRSRSALFHPGAARDFFTLGPVDRDEALCVEMARLAYVRSKADLAEFLGRVPLSLVHTFDEKGSQGFVAADQTLCVVAFRGTETDDPTDLFADVNFRPVPWEAGGEVHEGFARAFRQAEPDVRAHLPADRRLLLTGHSLGAALATLAATVWTADALYTYGSPRVGNAEFARLADRIPHHRYVDCCDLVCRVPPEGTWYRHSGARQFIDRQGVVRPDITDDEVDRERRAGSQEYLLRWGLQMGTVPLRELADHAPINYVSAVLGVRASDPGEA